MPSESRGGMLQINFKVNVFSVNCQARGYKRIFGYFYIILEWDTLHSSAHFLFCIFVWNLGLKVCYLSNSIDFCCFAMVMV